VGGAVSLPLGNRPLAGNPAGSLSFPLLATGPAPRPECGGGWKRLSAMSSERYRLAKEIFLEAWGKPEEAAECRQLLAGD
jgi:hypothetical protein